MIGIYWEIGKYIIESQEEHGWGKNIVDQLSKNLKREFPDQKGYSTRNLWEMRRFYDTYKDFTNLKQLVAEIPWGHHLVIMQRTNSHEERVYYLQSTANMAWSRNVLLNQMKAQAYERHQLESKQTNFQEILPGHFAEQANEMIKSRYSLEFLGIDEL